MIALQLIFWISLFLILYSYLLFPWILKWLARNKTISARTFSAEELPVLSVLIAAYNEELVIAKKIDSVLKSDYPHDKLEILVGSDASTDQTNFILQKLKETNPILQLFL